MNAIYATFACAIVVSLQITCSFILLYNRIDALEKKLTERKEKP